MGIMIILIVDLVSAMLMTYIINLIDDIQYYNINNNLN